MRGWAFPGGSLVVMLSYIPCCPERSLRAGPLIEHAVEPLRIELIATDVELGKVLKYVERQENIENICKTMIICQ